ncbi:spore coat protein [Candidatus Magnetomorum sp. HK-1]|nr:spore coat protein [Candidatus Magnetomorum sp. HK-1]
MKFFEKISCQNDINDECENSVSSIRQIIPYGRQSIDENDIFAACSALRSEWLTTGPKIFEFEQLLADYVGAKFGVAVSSGSAALHCAMYAINVKQRDEVIVPPITFVATANSVLYRGGIPVFVDVSPETLLIDPDKIEEKITEKTKAIIAVDYAGQPCDYDRLKKIADKYDLILIADACHSLGAKYKKKKVGSLADITVFSFHPVKHITTGEGGMITTDSLKYANRMKCFRNHGIDMDFRERSKKCSWNYDMVDLGYNHRITDIQCALGISQLKKLDNFIKRRQKIANNYNRFFAAIEEITPLKIESYSNHAFHLFVVKVHSSLNLNRDDLFKLLQKAGINVNVHYKPVYWHLYYQKIGFEKGICPQAEKAYLSILSLPIFPGLTDSQVNYITKTLKDILFE